jgi:pSer/pThr/pTyr-binding forkhead associated (FHA) protein
MATLVGVRLRHPRMAGDAERTVGLALDVPEPEALFGRSPGLGATVLLDCLSVAKRHARIWRAGDGHAIEDLGSANGTFVNGARLAPYEEVPLGDGDEVRFAHVLAFVFRAGSATRTTPSLT